MKSRPPEENRSVGSGHPPIVVLDAVLKGDRNYALRGARRLLASTGFCVHEAAGLSKALEAAMTHKPDVVLLSLGFPDPGLSGSGPPEIDEAEICRRLKGGSNVPAIVLLIPAERTGTTLPRYGADLCLPRGLAPSMLIEALRTLLRMRSAELELARSRKELVDYSMQLAHDIEGPLRGVVTFAELIGQAHPLSENERVYLGHVLSSAAQVRRLARGVLTYAQAKRDPPTLAAIPLRGVVAAAVHASRERIKEASAGIHVQDPLPTALGDFAALQQVIQSLIGNAIAYRCPETSLSLTVGAKQGSIGECLIFVSDNGIGVAKQYHESIFAPFKRLHGGEIPGAGMGLAICKHIVEAHGGRIWVESEPGRGASFWFTLRAPL